MKTKNVSDCTGHALLDTNTMYLFTPNFNLFSVLLATKTEFSQFHTNTKKNRLK